MTRGTPISDKRQTKIRLTKMLESKDLYSINDMIKSFALLNKNETDYFSKDSAQNKFDSEPNYAAVSSVNNGNDLIHGIDEPEETEEIVANLLNQISFNINKNKKLNIDYKRSSLNKKQPRSIELDDIDFDGFKKNFKKSNALSKSLLIPPFISCSPILSGN